MSDRSNADVVTESDRLVIRPWRVDEVDLFLEIYRRPEVVRWFRCADAGASGGGFAHRAQPRAAGRGSRFGRWAIVDRSGGTPVGTIILEPLPDRDGEVEIGWHLHPDNWGKGFATEAAGAILERGFAAGLREPDLENHRSAAVCRRIGMRLLGVTHCWLPPAQPDVLDRRDG